MILQVRPGNSADGNKQTNKHDTDANLIRSRLRLLWGVDFREKLERRQCTSWYTMSSQTYHGNQAPGGFTKIDMNNRTCSSQILIKHTFRLWRKELRPLHWSPKKFNRSRNSVPFGRRRGGDRRSLPSSDMKSKFEYGRGCAFCVMRMGRETMTSMHLAETMGECARSTVYAFYN